MSDLLHRLRQLDAEATPGKLCIEEPYGVGLWVVEADVEQHNWRIIASLPYPYEITLHAPDGRGPVLPEQVRANAELFVLLRNHLPQIIAALELNKAAQDVFAAGFHAAERHGLGDDRDGELALALEWAEFAALERAEESK